MPLTKLLQFSHREEPVRLSRSGFETIPSDLSKAELFRYFTYSAEDRFAIFECRGNNNKVGFALLLGSVRLTGRFPIHFDLLPGSLLAHVCKQLNIAGLLFLDYPQRPATLHQHKERIKAYLCLRNFVALLSDVGFKRCQRNIEWPTQADTVPGLPLSTTKEARVLIG
jgi:Domain of unknown function (DUF4158)